MCNPGTGRGESLRRGKRTRDARRILSLSLIPFLAYAVGDAPKAFRVALRGPVESLDPAVAESVSELILVSNLSEPLLTRDPGTGLAVPAAAEKVTSNTEGTTYTFSLRPGLSWSNGDPLRAEDFARSIRRFISDSYHSASGVREELKAIRGAEELREGAFAGPGEFGVKASDDRTLIIELTRPSSGLLDLLTLPETAPVHIPTVDRLKSRWWRPETWVGNGPFLPLLVGATQVVLKKNPRYHSAQQVALERIEVTLVASRDEGARLFKDGKVDQFGYRDFSVPGEKIAVWSGKPELLFEPDLRTTVVRLNLRRALTGRSAFRQALAMSFDRTLLISAFAREGEVPAFSVVPVGVKQYEPPQGYLSNLPGGLKTLRDLGYCVRTDAPRGCNAFPTMTMIHRDYPKDRKVALAVAAIWKQSIGIESVRAEGKSEEEFAKAIKDGAYDLALDDIAVTTERPFDFLLEAVAGEGGLRSPEYDKLLDLARSEPRWDRARSFYRRAEALLLREAGVIPILHGTIATLVSTRVRGWEANLWNLHPWSAVSLAP